MKERQKTSEIGGIPYDWKISPLVDLCIKIQDGTHFSPKIIGGPYLYITSRNIKFGHIDLTNAETIDKLQHEIIYRRCDVKEGDLLLTKDGANTGNAAINNLKEEFSLLSSVAFLRFDKISFDSRYFLQQILSFSGQSSIKEAMTGNAITRLTLDKIRKLSFPYPCKLDEQTAIATALSDADALISSLSTLIIKKRNIKQGAMQELLRPRDGWANKKIGEIGMLSGAGVDKKINPREKPVRLLNYMDVFKRDFIYSKELNHWVTAPDSKIVQCSILKGDVFFTPSSEMRYDIAICAVAMEDIGDAVYSYHLYRLRLLEDLDIKFRNYIFKTKDFLHQAETLCEGSGKRYVISLSKFREMTIWYPADKKEQIRISTILSEIDLEIAALEAKLKKYNQMKQGMMQQLLTGKIRLI